MRRKEGFTLLELSMVLLIIASIIGGVIVGQNMIRASKIRTALSEFDTYSKAIQEFKDKFMALPGDMLGSSGYRPTDIWGTETGCPNYTSSGKTKRTCNGDGNGTIGTSTGDGVLSNTYEWFRAWQHLSNAEFIKYAYGSSEVGISYYTPPSAITGAGWTLNYMLCTTTCSTGLWPDKYGHILHLTARSSGTFNTNPAITAEEALAMDSKIDDARPGYGKIRAWRTSVQSSCTTTDTAQLDQAYSYSSAGAACSLLFLLGY